MRVVLAAIALVIFATDCVAREFAIGATLQVKPNSIWFQAPDKLAQWQALRKRSDKKRLVAYQEQMLSRRDAWQFENGLNVKVLSYDAERNQVTVQDLTPGRFEGVKWVLDADAFAK